MSEMQADILAGMAAKRSAMEEVERRMRELPPPAVEYIPPRVWPRLTADQRAELGVAAPLVLAAGKSAAQAAERLAGLVVEGTWVKLAIVGLTALAGMASGVTLLGAAVAFAVCNDGEREDADDIEKTNASRAEKGASVPLEDYARMNHEQNLAEAWALMATGRREKDEQKITRAGDRLAMLGVPADQIWTQGEAPAIP